MTRKNLQVNGVNTGLKRELSGSWLKGTWKNVELLKAKTTTNLTPAFSTWVSADTNNSSDNKSTGYDAPGGEADKAFDKRLNGKKTPYSKTIVQFDSDENINRQMRAAEYNSARYATETVEVNLGMVARPVGEAVQ